MKCTAGKERSSPCFLDQQLTSILQFATRSIIGTSTYLLDALPDAWLLTSVRQRRYIRTGSANRRMGNGDGPDTGDNATDVRAAARPKIDDPVGLRDDSGIVLGDRDRAIRVDLG